MVWNGEGCMIKLNKNFEVAPVLKKVMHQNNLLQLSAARSISISQQTFGTMVSKLLGNNEGIVLTNVLGTPSPRNCYSIFNHIPELDGFISIRWFGIMSVFDGLYGTHRGRMTSLSATSRLSCCQQWYIVTELDLLVFCSRIILDWSRTRKVKYN